MLKTVMGILIFALILSLIQAGISAVFGATVITSLAFFILAICGNGYHDEPNTAIFAFTFSLSLGGCVGGWMTNTATVNVAGTVAIVLGIILAIVTALTWLLVRFPRGNNPQETNPNGGSPTKPKRSK